MGECCFGQQAVLAFPRAVNQMRLEFTKQQPPPSVRVTRCICVANREGYGCFSAVT
jgi:hypothetical protein